MPRFVRLVRIIFASLFGLIGGLCLIASLTVANPLAFGRVGGLPSIQRSDYCLFATSTSIGAMAYYLGTPPSYFAHIYGSIAVVCLVMFVGLEIRHLLAWRTTQ